MPIFISANQVGETLAGRAVYSVLGRHFRTTDKQLAELLARSGTSPFSTGLEPIDRRRWRYLAKRWREWLDAAQEIL